VSGRSHRPARAAGQPTAVLSDGSGSAARPALVLSELRAGGMEQVVAHLARGWAALGRSPLVVCLQAAGPLAAGVEDAGVPVEAIGSVRGRDVLGLLRLARALRRFRPDVINVHDYASLPYVALARRLGAGAPTVFTAHGLLYRMPPRLGRRHRRAARCLTALTAVSEQTAARHREYLGWDGEIPVIPNGVPDLAAPAGAREALRRELDVGPEQVLWLAAGNARPEKGFEDLLAAADLLRGREPARRCAVAIAGTVSDDAYGRSLRRQRAELKLDDTVRLLGLRSDMPSLYAAADAFVLSSRSEGMPMVLLEAMMASLPVVATRVGGVSEAVPAEAGVLVPPGDPQRLAAAMAELADSPARRRAMAQAARAHARATHSVERMAAGYLDVFDRLVARPARPGDAQP